MTWLANGYWKVIAVNSILIQVTILIMNIQGQKNLNYIQKKKYLGVLVMLLLEMTIIPQGMWIKNYLIISYLLIILLFYIFNLLKVTEYVSALE